MTYKWGDIISLEYGKPVPDKEITNGLYPVYGTNGQIGTSNLQPLCPHPSVILGRKGAYRGVHYSATPFSVIDTAFFIRSKFDNLDLKWAYYKFLTYDMNRMDSGSAIPSTDRYEIYAISVELPSLEEQRIIADTLTALDDKIANNTAVNHHLEQMAQAIFKAWFVDFEPSKPFTDIVQVLGGGTPKTGTEEYWNGDIPFFTPKDALSTYTLTTEKTLTKTGLSSCNSRLYPVNTVFVTARGTVGKLALAGCPMAMNQSCYALFGKEGFGQFFVYHLAQYAVAGLKNKASGAVFDAIVTRDFDSEVVPAPSADDACFFEEKVIPIYETILNNSKENARLTALRNTLLPRLMSGELSVADISAK